MTDPKTTEDPAPPTTDEPDQGVDVGETTGTADPEEDD